MAAPATIPSWAGRAPTRCSATPATTTSTAAPTTALAQEFQEQDFQRQSRSCEISSLLPWADVDNGAWVDCVTRRHVRSLEERERDYSEPRTPWNYALMKSFLMAIYEGCERWAINLNAPDPPQMRQGALPSWNHA